MRAAKQSGATFLKTKYFLKYSDEKAFGLCNYYKFYHRYIVLIWSSAVRNATLERS
jgi:hypothetical protein